MISLQRNGEPVHLGIEEKKTSVSLKKDSQSSLSDGMNECELTGRCFESKESWG